MYQVIKRDGTVVDFNVQKIRDAILKAFTACNRNEHPSVTDFLALKTTADFESKIKDNKISVEDIQDSVENVLSKAGYSDVAKAYILYRKNHEKMRNIKGTFLDYKDLVNNYLNVNSWRVKENSTVTYSIGGLILSNSGAITANYWLSEIYDDEIANAHRNADMHIHDLSMLTGYCFTGDTRIKTLDGKNPSFEDLVESGTKELWVFAFDADKNCVTIAKAINPRVTRTTNELVEITLTSGEIIRCTPDHLFMLRDGSYMKAKDLEENTSLMSVFGREKAKIGHCVCSVKTIELDEPIKMYDLTVPGYENFALDAGVFVHNCAGWSIKQLIQEGLGGVPGKITSAPASHLSTLCNQMVNFFGILQNEWAGKNTM